MPGLPVGGGGGGGGDGAVAMEPCITLVEGRKEECPDATKICDKRNKEIDCRIAHHIDLSCHEQFYDSSGASEQRLSG